MMFKSVITRIAATALFVGAVASCGGSDSDARTRNGMLVRPSNNTINNCLVNNVANINNTICNIDDNITNNNIINITTTTIGSANVSTTTLQPIGDDVVQQNSATTTTVVTTSSAVISNDVSNSNAPCSITVTYSKLSACKAVTKVVYQLKRGSATVAAGIKDVVPATKSLTFVKKTAKAPTKGTLTISFADGTSTAVSIGKFDGKSITVYPK